MLWIARGTSVVILFAMVGCGANNIRPRSHPKVDAVVDTIEALPEVVVDSLHAVVTRRGFETERMSTAEGFLETKWFDLTRGQSGGKYTRHPDRVVLLRFFADPASNERTVLHSEVVFRKRLDPSMDDDLLEVMAPVEHPGDSLLQSVLDEVRSRPTEPNS